MSTTTPPAPPRKPALRQKLAVVLFTITVPILATEYWKHGGRITLLGDVPASAMFLIAAIGSAVSFGLFAERQHRWIAPIPGAISGLGAFGFHILYTQWMELERMRSSESLMVSLLGATPGILMFWAVTRMGKKLNC